MIGATIGLLRDECLNVLERWRQDYNHCRPHSSLDDLAPTAFAERTVTKYNYGLLEVENLSTAVV